MLDLTALKSIIEEYGEALGQPVRPLEIGGRVFDFNQRRGLMGVINLSQDSAYRESICRDAPQAIARGIELAAQGADLVDIGVESTLPHARKVEPAAQIDRLIPVVSALAGRGIAVSAESYYPEVLEAAGKAGARVFNLTGSREEAAVLRLAQRFEAAVILCYVQGETVRDVRDFVFGEDTIAEMEADFRRRTERAQALGVSRCILDPGLGFYYRNLEDGALRVAHQIKTFLQTFRLARLGYPILNILPHAPDIFSDEDRRAAEPFFAVLALLGGTHIIRTHELRTVAKIRRVMEGFGG